MPRFLEQWFDPSVEPPETFQPEEFESQQANRITHMMALAYFAGAVPRRLGGSATPEELKQDKQFCKKMRNRIRLFHEQWGAQPADFEEYLLENTTELQQEGAQIDWHTYLPTYFESMRNTLRMLASLAYGSDDPEKTLDRKVANRYANRILNEIAQVHQLYSNIYPDNPANV